MPAGCFVCVSASHRTFLLRSCCQLAVVCVSASHRIAQLLPRLIGSQRALEMSLGCAPVDAATAASWGLVARVVPPAAPGGDSDVLAEGRALGARILGNWARMVRGYKRTVREGLELPLGAALGHERARAAEYYRSMSGEDWARLAGFMAAKKGRAPRSKM